MAPSFPWPWPDAQMRGRRQRRGGNSNYGLFLLVAQIMQIGVNNIPPVTLATLALNVLVYMKLLPFLPSVHGACTSNNNVINDKQWQRLFYSSFYHLDDMHLYFNMASFLWKAINLERKLKSRKFLILLLVFSVLTQVVMLGLNQVFYEMFSSQYYLYTCAAGFSAVIFALKVLTTSMSDNNVSVMGIPLGIPAKYACWVELIAIQILVPNASFTGHLAGILVGFIYTHGPLSKIIDALDGVFTAIPSTGPSYRYQSGPTGHETTREDASQHSFGGEDEDLQRAIRESLRFNQPHQREQQPSSQRPPSYGWNVYETKESNSQSNIYPDLGDIRQSNPYPPSNNSHRAAPSAPPYENNEYTNPNYPAPIDHSSPPYPAAPIHHSTPPYPVDDSIPPRHELYNESYNNNTNSNETFLPSPSRSDTDDCDVVRAARLRRFTKN